MSTGLTVLVLIGSIATILLVAIVENGGAKLDHRAANRSCFWAE